MSDWHAQYVDAYRRHRLEDQRDYYAQRARTFDRARRSVITSSAVFMVLAALFGALGAGDVARRPMWAFIAAAVAAIGTALTSFEAAFGLERYARVFGEAQRALTLAAADVPGEAELTRADGTARVQGFTDQVERILADESDTWSNYTRDDRKDEAAEDGGA